MTYSPTWISESTQIGWTAPGNVDVDMKVPAGTVATFRDAVLGGGEFIYLLGAANTILGSVVTYQLSDGVSLNGTTVLWAGTANTGSPVAVATAAIVAAKWGWYQIGGAAIVATSGTVAAGNPLYYQTTGVVQAAAVNGKQIEGAVAGSANGVPTTNQTIVTLDRPHVQSQIV
jgi:hypothetical protein